MGTTCRLPKPPAGNGPRQPNRRRVVASLAAAALAAPGAGGAASASPLRITLPALPLGALEHTVYFPQLLRLALTKTGDEGPFEIGHFPEPMSSLRQIAELSRRGAINVMWDGTSHQRETELLPVRISLLRELNDYRVLLIREEDQPRFSRLRSLDDLRSLQAGAGDNWPSVDVLRHNRLPVVTTSSFGSLFPMLRAGRFDYLPRGVHEVWAEQRSQAAQGLAIEQTVFLHYPVPFYFFVSRDDAALAARIERGLFAAQADGSFDKLFLGIPSFQRGRDEIHAGKRRILALQMPPPGPALPSSGPRPV
jgi:ABC-type amino acid transport substrate-binding protein